MKKKYRSSTESYWRLGMGSLIGIICIALILLLGTLIVKMYSK